MEGQWKRWSKFNYVPLHQKEAQVELQNSELQIHKVSIKSRIALYMSLSLNIFLSLLVAYDLFNAQQSSANELLRSVSTYSPLFENINLSLHDEMVDIPVFNNPRIIYRDPPSPEVDEAWERVAQMGIFTISEDQVKRLGKDPETAARAPTEWGRGDDAYLARLQGQHNLHCLNTIRKYSYFSYYYGEAFGANKSTLDMPLFERSHHSHCLYTILQALMCQPNMNIFTDVWVEEGHRPWADYAVNRKCVNHDAILEWQKEQVWIDVGMLDSMRPPPWAKFSPVPKELAVGDNEHYVKGCDGRCG